MLKPINNHILIEPLKYDSFISQDKATFEEIGIVINFDDHINDLMMGDKVYFDSWLAAKYPKNEKEFYWLVRFEDIRAIER